MLSHCYCRLKKSCSRLVYPARVFAKQLVEKLPQISSHALQLISFKETFGHKHGAGQPFAGCLLCEYDVAKALRQHHRKLGEGRDGGSLTFA